MYATHPLGFLPFLSSFPQRDDLPQTNPPPHPTPALPCLFRGPHYRRCCQSWRSRVRAEDQRDRYARPTPPPGLINQLLFFPHPTNETALPLRTERRREGRRKESGSEGRREERENVNKSASPCRVSFSVFLFLLTLSRTRTLMSGLRHRDAPVMPLGPSVFVPHLRHLVGDLDLSPHSDQTHTHMHTPSLSSRDSTTMIQKGCCVRLSIYLCRYIYLYIYLYIYIYIYIYLYNLNIYIYIQIDR